MTKRAKPVSDKVRLEIIHQKKNYSISDTKLGGIFGVSVSKIRRIWLEYRINMKSRRSNYNRSGDVWKESKILGQNIYKNKEWCKLLGDIKCKRGRGNVNVEESRMITSQNIETASPPKIILNIQELESPRGVLNTENLACSEAFSSIHLGHPGGLSTQCPSSNLSSQLLPASPTTLFTPLNTTDLYSTPPQNRIKYYKIYEGQESYAKYDMPMEEQSRLRTSQPPIYVPKPEQIGGVLEEVKAGEKDIGNIFERNMEHIQGMNPPIYIKDEEEWRRRVDKESEQRTLFNNLNNQIFPKNIITSSPKEFSLARPMFPHNNTQRETNIVNIRDKEMESDAQYCSEYANDVYKHLLQTERIYIPPEGFLNQGRSDITYRMRAILFDWMSEVVTKFLFSSDTLLLSFNLIDRYLHKNINHVRRSNLQLVGIVGLSIAAKFNESFHATPEDYIYITENSFSKTNFLEMEFAMLSAVEYNLNYPSPMAFLRRYAFLSRIPFDSPVFHHAHMCLLLALMDHKLSSYTPSMLAAGSFYLAMKYSNNNIFGAECWGEVLFLQTGYFKSQVKEAAKAVYNYWAYVANGAGKGKYESVLKQFLHIKYSEVGIYNPSKTHRSQVFITKNQYLVMRQNTLS